MSHIEIVSHPLCPLAQRLVLEGMLAGKSPGRDFTVTYLAYPTLRETARLHSETGELPVLKLDGVTVSTSAEHAAEFLDARFGAKLLPGEPGARLLVRGIERGVGSALDALRGVFTASDRASLDTAFDQFFAQMARIERGLETVPTPTLSRMDEVALAPLASLTGAFATTRDHAGWAGLPRLSARMTAYRDDARVAESRCPDYAGEFAAFFTMTGSAFPTLIATR